jgi:polynucleotide 5'-kinase involved in rRNA processing
MENKPDLNEYKKKPHISAVLYGGCDVGKTALFNLLLYKCDLYYLLVAYS